MIQIKGVTMALVLLYYRDYRGDILKATGQIAAHICFAGDKIAEREMKKPAV